MANNLVFMGIYLAKGLFLTAGLFVVSTALALAGYRAWRLALAGARRFHSAGGQPRTLAGRRYRASSQGLESASHCGHTSELTNSAAWSGPPKQCMVGQANAVHEAAIRRVAIRAAGGAEGRRVAHAPGVVVPRGTPHATRLAIGKVEPGAIRTPGDAFGDHESRMQLRDFAAKGGAVQGAAGFFVG